MRTEKVVQVIQAYRNKKGLNVIVESLRAYMTAKADEIIEMQKNAPSLAENGFQAIDAYWKANPVVSDYFHYDENLYVEFTTLLSDGYPRFTAKVYAKESENFVDLFDVWLSYESFISDAYFLSEKYEERFEINEKDFQHSIHYMATWIHQEVQQTLWNY